VAHNVTEKALIRFSNLSSCCFCPLIPQTSHS
jgi:hypothetical protein